MGPSSLWFDFVRIYDLVRAINEISADELRSFSLTLRSTMQSKSFDPSIVSALLRRPGEFRQIYEQNSKAIAGAAFDAAETFLKARSGQQRQYTRIEDNLRFFLATEAISGLDGYVSVPLNRKGVYAALGDASLTKFRMLLREALSHVAPPHS